MNTEKLQQEPEEHIVSIDPGEVNCGVIRYNVTNDKVIGASLYNLRCCCSAEERKCGPIEELWSENNQNGKKEKKRKSYKQPSSHDLPGRLLLQIKEDANNGPFAYSDPQFHLNCENITLLEDEIPSVLVVVESQQAEVVRNMTVEACLVSRFFETVKLQDPKKVKKFWNEATNAAGLPVAFRGGSHAINKTDARAMEKRILDETEQALLRRATHIHASHRSICPGTKKTNKGRRVRKQDDLMDAILQAICVAHEHLQMEPGDKNSPAMRRLLAGVEREKMMKMKPKPKRQYNNKSVSRKKRKRKQKKNVGSNRKERPKKRSKITKTTCVDMWGDKVENPILIM